MAEAENGWFVIEARLSELFCVERRVVDCCFTVLGNMNQHHYARQA